MVPILAAAGGAVAGLTAGEAAVVGLAGLAIKEGAGMYVAKQAAAAVATRAAAAAVPWVVGGFTIYQLGKLGYKLLASDDDKNKK